MFCKAWLIRPLLACLALTATTVPFAPWIPVTQVSSVSQRYHARFFLQYHVICCSCCLECFYCSSECLLICHISSQVTLSETPTLPLPKSLQTRLVPLLFFSHLYFFLQNPYYTLYICVSIWLKSVSLGRVRAEFMCILLIIISLAPASLPGACEELNACWMNDARLVLFLLHQWF